MRSPAHRRSIPGYGFLSENATFVQALEDHGITFIGPTAEHIRIMGDKITAKDTMKKLGVPCVPGSDGGVADVAEAKKVAGGNRLSGHHQGDGRRRRAWHEGRQERETSWRSPSGPRAPRPRPHSAMTKSIWRNTFSARAISRCRSSATAKAAQFIWVNATVPCSAATRKCLKRPPVPSLMPNNAGKDRQDLCRCRCQDRLFGAGTIEFLFEDGEFYFIEMNTRLQVEHPVTEGDLRR